MRTEEQVSDTAAGTAALASHERVCAIRYASIDERLENIETALRGWAVKTIFGLSAIICVLVFYLLTKVH